MSQGIELLDVVALTGICPIASFAAGRLEPSWRTLAPNVFKVEFTDNDRRAFASLALKADQLMVLHYRPVEAS